MFLGCSLLVPGFFRSSLCALLASVTAPRHAERTPCGPVSCRPASLQLGVTAPNTETLAAASRLPKTAAEPARVMQQATWLPGLLKFGFAYACRFAC